MADTVEGPNLSRAISGQATLLIAILGTSVYRFTHKGFTILITTEVVIAKLYTKIIFTAPVTSTEDFPTPTKAIHR